MGRAAEDRLRECSEGDLLVQEGLVFLEEGHLCDVAGQHVVGGQVAAVEGEEQVAQPGVRGADEAVEDGVQQQLAEVVDGVADQRGDGQVVGARLAVAQLEGADVDAGEVEEGVFVVGGEFVLRLSRVLVGIGGYSRVAGCGYGVGYLVVLGGGLVVVCVHDRLDRVEAVEDLLALVELLLGAFLVL